MQFNLVRRSGDANITVIIDGDLYVADDQHPNFENIVEAVLAEADESEVLALIDASVEAGIKFANLSERVTVANGRVRVDGDDCRVIPAHTPLPARKVCHDLAAGGQ